MMNILFNEETEISNEKQLVEALGQYDHTRQFAVLVENDSNGGGLYVSNAYEDLDRYDTMIHTLQHRHAVRIYIDVKKQ